MPYCSYRYTTLGQLKISTRTNRNSFFLPDAERRVMMFVLDRTIGWHNVWAPISLRHFVNGVFRRKNGRDLVLIRGTGLTLDEVKEAVARLHEHQAIEIEQLGRRTIYKINEFWSHPDLRSLHMWEINGGDYEESGDDED